MKRLRLLIACAVVVIGVTIPLTASAVPPGAGAATATYEYTQNMHPLGYSARQVPLDNTVAGQGSFNSDLAFWGKTAVQGTYAGFRLVDVSAPSNPKEIVNWEQCESRNNSNGNQGDVIIWGDLLIRSWNSGTPAPHYPAGHPLAGQTIPVTDPARFTTPGAFCGDWPMFREPAAPPLPERGQEGVHIIDISDPTSPDVIGFVDTPCGSHTETLVPDLANDRLLVYSNSSANTTFGVPGGGELPLNCRGIDIIEVPLDDPASASYLRFERSGDPDEDIEHAHSCHDTSVILGDANLVSCTGSGGPGNGRQRVHHRPRPRRLEGRPEVALPQGDGRHRARPLLIVHVGRRGPWSSATSPAADPAPTARRPTTRSSGRSSTSTPTPGLRSASSRSHGRKRTSRTARPTTTTSSRFATGT